MSVATASRLIPLISKLVPLTVTLLMTVLLLPRVVWVVPVREIPVEFRLMPMAPEAPVTLSSDPERVAVPPSWPCQFKPVRTSWKSRLSMDPADHSRSQSLLWPLA